MGGISKQISRRHALQVGGLGLAGLSLSDLLAAEESAAGPQPRADHCIILMLNGGPSHLDMWDMKPEAAAEIRGEFKPIATSLPGYQMCELLPRMAGQAHRATVVRSMHHSVNNAHAAAVYCALTGHDRGEIGGGARQTDNPAPGSVLTKLRPPVEAIVPFVHLPYITKEGAGGPPQPGFFGGLMGRAWDPLFITRDPNADDFSVPELTLIEDVSEKRLAAREGLFTSIDQRLNSSAGADSAGQMTNFQRRAFDLLTSEQTQRALRIDEEPAAVREQYGRNVYGQSVLLSRRLIEAGSRLVTVSWAPDANATWDTHGNNFTKLRNELLPQLDAACSSLIEDLSDRGLLERTVIAVMGDFGRTPKINGNAGRDHWNWCYSLMLVGGGFRPGLIYGASDDTGAYPARDALIPGDIIATIYHALGIPHDGHVLDPLGRPFRIVPTGEVVPELLT
jgi:hypothetical protein